MVNGWRKAFCTSIPRDREPKITTEKKQQHCENSSTNPSPRISSKFGFFSNPSTPRCQTQAQSTGSSTLRCRTSVATSCSVPNSPKLKCSTNPKTPKSFTLSNPSSPKSPSSFSFLKATLRLSKNRCGICMQSVKSGQGTAIYTAECSHTFHFPCISSHVTKQPLHVCPVCGTNWKELPVLAIHNEKKTSEGNRNFKVYNDDEPLMSPTSLSSFNPIPESENETEDEDDEKIEFQGFNVKPVATVTSSPVMKKNLEVCLMPETAVVAANRNYETYAVVLKMRPSNMMPVCYKARRAPVDIVTVLDVGGAMSGEKLRLLKNAMRLVISSLTPTDRLSIVAFSGGSKRLLPLKRMTGGGQRSARRIVEALAAIDQTRDGVPAKNDALKKAAKVLEDRREKNSFACIIVLSDIVDSRAFNASFQKSTLVSSTRLPNADINIPIHLVRFPKEGECSYAPEETLANCVTSLLTVVAQDVRIQLKIVSRSRPVEIAAVYSLAGRPAPLGSGLIKIGDLYSEEERELLLELKVPAVSAGSHHVLTVLSSYRDPLTREIQNPVEHAMLIPRPHTVRSSNEKIERLRNLHVTVRAVAESSRLADHSDISGAHHLLSSARALLLQSSKPVEEYLRWIEAEQADFQKRRQQSQNQIQRQRNSRAEEKMEQLTPTSAWRAAERLAKVAIMRKSMNRVSDLHGFENARF